MATLTGGSADDPLAGTPADDLLLGLAGADTLVGGAGDDTLDAGTGADRLDGGAGTDRAILDRRFAPGPLRLHLLPPTVETAFDGAVLIGIEALTLRAGDGQDSLRGGAGADDLAGGEAADALAGAAGADTLRGETGDDTLLGGAGADILAGGAGADAFALQDAAAGLADSTLLAMDTIEGFNPAGGDRLWLRGQSVAGRILSLDGPGRFALADGSPVPVGYGGALAARPAPVAGMTLPDATGGAAIRAFWLPSATAGDQGGWVILDIDRNGRLGTTDLVLRLDLDTGATVTEAAFAPGSFARLGTIGADSLAGTAADEVMEGFGGADRLSGGAGNDSLLGGDGADTLAGEAGFDTLRGGTGADSLSGGEDIDALDGGEGADTLEGGAAADVLLGGTGADWLLGGAGDDTLEAAGRGDGGPLETGDAGDRLEGGDGADLFVLHGMGDPAWSGLEGATLVADFASAQGDRLRISDAWAGAAEGRGATAGTLAGPDGIARPLVFSGSPGGALTTLPAGLRLSAQPLPGLDAIQVFWVRAETDGGAPAGGWLVIDLDRDGVLGGADAVARIGSASAPLGIGAQDFIAGTFLGFGTAAAPQGTAGNDHLRGGSLAEAFLGTGGSDTLEGGAGAPDAVSYAALAGAIAFAAEAAPGQGQVRKAGGGTDLLRGIHGVVGTALDDTLDGSAAPAAGLVALTLEGRQGADRLLGNGTAAVQASYAASPGAVRVDLGAGTAADGWGGIDTLIGIRRVAVTAPHDDTVLGSAADEVFLSGTAGSKRFEGGGGTDDYRYAGSGAVAILLAPETVGGASLPARADKPGGARDLLFGFTVATGGAGDDLLRGGAAAERLAGGPGADTIDGGAGLDTVFYDVQAAATGGLMTRGVVLDLAAGMATDPWGAADTLLALEHAWGTHLADDLTGLAVPGAWTYLRGLAGDDTLRAPAGGGLVAADHASDPAGILADLGAGTVRDGWGGQDALAGIAALRGSAFGDSVAAGAMAAALDGGGGADTLAGGLGADTLLGGEGSDSLAGGAGADLLQGGEGADTLDGGAGADTLEGGAGDDLYRLDDPADRAGEGPDGGGTDTILAGFALILPDGIEHAVLAATAPGLEVQGQGLGNRLTGAGGADRLLGWGGDDTLAGGEGADTLLGNIGADLLSGGGLADRLLGGPGADTIQGGAGEDSLYGEDESDSLSGDDGLDRIEAGPGDDILDGGPGNDTLFGQAGADTLRGTAGADWLLGGEGADVAEGGEGDDVQYGEAESDTLRGGAGQDFLYGGPGDDSLDGEADVDSLRGDAGNDRVAGGLGNDFAYGGLGDDTLEGGEGIDNLWGEAGRDLLLGGEGDDWLMAGEDADTLRGGAGIDNLWGHAGDDWLEGDDETGFGPGASDWLRGGDGADTLFGGVAVDNLWGEAGNDLIDGGPGNDQMNGGPGDDTYLVDDPRDALFEQALWGEDLVLAEIGFALPPFIEHLILEGVAGDAGADGNVLDNRILGNAGANRLVGWDGADTLHGEAGADTLIGAEGTDTLYGQSAADSLVGGGADDLLVGGTGADTLRGDAGADRYVFEAGDGADLIQGFEPGVDLLVLRWAAAAALPAILAGAQAVPGGTLLGFGAGDSVLLAGLAPGALGLGDLLAG
jgi:Ca2+-binding RTX toxin-like protein